MTQIRGARKMPDDTGDTRRQLMADWTSKVRPAMLTANPTSTIGPQVADKAAQAAQTAAQTAPAPNKPVIDPAAMSRVAQSRMLMANPKSTIGPRVADKAAQAAQTAAQTAPA